jgi:hypothetical protein
MISNEPNLEKPKKSLTELSVYSIIGLVGMAFFAVVMGAIFYYGVKADKNIIRYDCRQLIGGWHPDVPPKVIEECRKRSGRI